MVPHGAPGEVVVVDAEGPGGARRLRIRFPRHAEGRGQPQLLIVHDAQNVFASAETGSAERWNFEQAMSELEDQRIVPPQLTIGIDHRGVLRMKDYSPWGLPSQDRSVEALAHEAYVLEVVLPLAAGLGASTHFATTTLVGSSLGGLVSLWLAARNPRSFGRVLALSPSVMWGKGFGRLLVPHEEAPLKIYLDAGSDERFQGLGGILDYGKSVRRFAHDLEALGYPPEALRLRTDPGAEHGEHAWARRLPGALRWGLR